MKRQVSSYEKSGFAEEFPWNELDKYTICKIQNCLDVQSFLRFKRTCRYICHLTDLTSTQLYTKHHEAQVLQRTRANLEAHGILVEMEEFLSTYNGVLAGGFVLMNVGQGWPKYDIDIFLPKLSKLQLMTFTNHVFRLFHVRLNFTENLSTYMEDAKRNDSTVITNHIETLKMRALQVQFIFTEHKDAGAYVKLNFDFSFCKIYTNLHTLYCHNYFHQACKVGYIDNPKDTQRLIERIQKYTRRGFRFLSYMH